MSVFGFLISVVAANCAASYAASAVNRGDYGRALFNMAQVIIFIGFMIVSAILFTAKG